MRWNSFFPFHNGHIHTTGNICSRYKNWLNQCLEESSPGKELKRARQHFSSHAALVNSLLHRWCLCPNQCTHWAAPSSHRLEELGGSSLPPSNVTLFRGDADLLGNLWRMVPFHHGHMSAGVLCQLQSTSHTSGTPTGHDYFYRFLADFKYGAILILKSRWHQLCPVELGF